MDSNQRRHSQQIYSLPPLTTRTLPHKSGCRNVPKDFSFSYPKLYFFA